MTKLFDLYCSPSGWTEYTRYYGPEYGTQGYWFIQVEGSKDQCFWEILLRKNTDRVYRLDLFWNKDNN